MGKMIIYKEWLKTRWVLLAIFAVFAGALFYSLLNLTKVVEFRGAAILWSTLVAKDTVLIEILRYLPAVAGGMLAAAQFLPETGRKRLKLTLHLPYPEWKMILMIVCYGLVSLTFVFAFSAAVSALVLGQWIAAELVGRIVRTMLVWFLAGYAAYIWTAAVCLEPTWKVRALLLVLLGALMWLMFLSAVPEAYNGFLPWLCLYTAASYVLVRGSVARFKEGCQDR